MQAFFLKQGWTGSGKRDGAAVRLMLATAGVKEVDLAPDVRSATVFEDERLARVFGEALWGTTNAEFDAAVTRLLAAS